MQLSVKVMVEQKIMRNLKTDLALFSLLIVLIAGSNSVFASKLSEAANSMAPGEWRSFDTQGFTRDLVNACGAATFITDYARDAVWNPYSREVHFVGQGHYACQKHIRYNENDNTWYEVSRAGYESVGIGHAYEHNTIDPATGTIYYAKYNSRVILKYENGSWSSLPDFPDSPAITKAIEYFPEMNGLIVVDPEAGIWLFSEITKNWKKLSNPVEMGPYHVFAEYSPVHKVIIFGGGNGSTKVNKLDANGNVFIDNIANSPGELGTRHDQGLVQADTSTGNFLAFMSDNTQYVYDVPSNTWSLVGNKPISIASTVSAAIPEYNVILFASADDGVHLYKLGASSGTLPPAPTIPVAPTNLKIK